MYNLYTGMLRMCEDFRDDGREVELVYQTDEALEVLKETYELEKRMGTGSEFDKIISLLQWETDHIFHKGDYDNHIRNRAVDLFEYSYDKEAEKGINCRSLSISLTECYLSVGIKARVVYLMPFSPYDGDNHVVCEAWSKDYNKWIMVDPTYGLYLMDEEGTPLNIIEIREKLAFQEKLKFNEGCHYNGNPIEEKEIIEYYAKDFFYFQIKRIQGYDVENIENNWMVTIAPNGYNVKKRIIANIDYRIKKWGDNEQLQRWRKAAEDDFLIYKDIKLLK